MLLRPLVRALLSFAMAVIAAFYVCTIWPVWDGGPGGIPNRSLLCFFMMRVE